MRSKNQASAFYCYGLVNIKKLFHKLLPIKIIMHTQLKDEKRHAPENCLPASSKNNGLSLTTFHSSLCLHVFCALV